MIRFANFKQSPIRYSDTGKGRAIVLIHGFLESIEVWDEFSEKLSKKFRVIAIEMPGHGETASIGYIHTMELMAKCVKAVMNQLQLRRYVLVGHSMGGYTALAFAQLFPENVSGLCLFHSTSLPDSEERKISRDRAIEAVKKEHKQFVNNFFDKLFAPQNVVKFTDRIEELKKHASKITKQGVINALEGMKARVSREAILESSNFPVLFIAGKMDSIIPFGSIQPQAILCKKATVLILEHAGHMGFYEEKEKTLEAIYKFSKSAFKKSET